MTRFVYHQNDRYVGAGVIKLEQLGDFSEQLIDLYTAIVESGDLVCKDRALYEVEVLPGIALCELIYGVAASNLSRDCLSAFRTMIDQSPIIDYEKLSEASMVGTIGLVPSKAECELDGKEDWVTFVRLDLIRNEKSVNEFYSDFSIAFPRLKFSNRFPACLNTFDGGHSSYSGIITRCLASLNDGWADASNGDLPEMLRAFSTLSRCPTSLEGNGARKGALTFSFSLGVESSESVLCEPHMKLERSDVSGDSEYYYHRIYFCPRYVTGFSERILVGYAGKHL